MRVEFIGQTSTQVQLKLPDPRLIELRRAYAELAGHPARSLSLWIDTFVKNIDLARFRSSNSYLPCDIKVADRTLYWKLAARYTQAADQLGLLDELVEDGAFGAECFQFMEHYTVSRDLLDSINELNFLSRTIDIHGRSAFRVLDIGAGYGRLMHRMVEAWPHTTTYCADSVAESTFICEAYAGFRERSMSVKVIPLHRIDAALRNAEIDIGVNVHSFSECPLEAVLWWLDLLESTGARHLFIVPNPSRTDGERLFTREADGGGYDFRPAIEKRGFHLTHSEMKYRNQMLANAGMNTLYFLFERW